MVLFLTYWVAKYSTYLWCFISSPFIAGLSRTSVFNCFCIPEKLLFFQWKCHRENTVYSKRMQTLVIYILFWVRVRLVVNAERKLMYEIILESLRSPGYHSMQLKWVQRPVKMACDYIRIQSHERSHYVQQHKTQLPD